MTQTSIPQSTPSRIYYPELDGVRAIATALVMIFHMAQQGIPIPGPVMLGQTGVDLFFVLSGFLITTILLKSPPHDWHEVRTFYIRRTLRIFPLYYGFLIAAALLHSPVSTPFWFYLQNLYLSFRLPIQGPDHFWSLAVEEQFYLVWPFVVLFLPRRFLLVALWLMILGAPLCRIVLIDIHASPFYFTLSRIDGLAAGALLAVLLARGTLFSLRKGLVALTIAMTIIVAIEGALAHHAGTAWIQVTKFSCITALYAAVLGLLLTSAPSVATRWLRSAPLRFVGRISYGLYVFHPVVYAFVFPRIAHQPALIRAAAGTGATFALALLSWYGFERYFIGLKDRLAPERARFPRRAPSMTAL